MPSLPHAPSVFLDDDDIRDFCRDVSERLRRHGRLRPLLDRLIGNRWEAFESGFETLIRSTLFETGGCETDLSWLARIAGQISSTDCDAAEEVFLDACLAMFPLQAAAGLDVINAGLRELAGELLAETAPDRLEMQLRRAEATLRAGALLSRL